MMIRSLCLVIALGVSIQVSQAQTALNVRVPRNPFEPNSSTSALITLVDRSSPSLVWFTEYSASKDEKGEIVSYLRCDSAMRILQLSEVERAEFEKQIRNRLEKHQQNFAKLHEFQMREQEEYAVKAGLPEHRMRYTSVPKIDAKTTKSLIEEYEKAEWKSEMELMEVLDEVVGPNKFAVLVDHWRGPHQLYAPYAAHFLGLSNEQVSEIRKVCMDAMKTEFTIRSTAKPIKDGMKQLKENLEYQKLVFRPYSLLTSSQLKKAVIHLMPNKRPTSFSQRLNELKEQSETDIRARAELEVLGELYQALANSAEANSN